MITTERVTQVRNLTTICTSCGTMVTPGARFCGVCGNALTSAQALSNKAKGTQLEQQVATFFAANGYAVTPNAILEGRSGGKHEIDVLAKKSDGITTFSLAVECKAWQKPIEKDIVSKLSYILSDLGINKGVIVSLAGWTSGTELAAQQLGIELWGPDEIALRLGKAAIARIENVSIGKAVDGFPVTMSTDQLHKLLQSDTKGLFGLGQEELVWAKLIWLSFYLLEIRCSRTEKERFRKAAMKVAVTWALYNGLDGAFYTRSNTGLNLQRLSSDIVVLPLIKEGQIRQQLTQAMEKRRSVVTASARQRYNAALAAHGIPLPVEHISIDATRQVCIPFYVGLLRRQGKDRIVAVDAHIGKLSAPIARTLTSHITYLIDSIK